MAVATRVSSGQSFEDSPLMNAAVVNELFDCVADWKRVKQGSPLGDNNQSVFPGTDWVKVQNLTGADRAAGDVVQLGTLLVTPIDKRNLWFQGNAVASPAVSKYAICTQPIAQNLIGPAAVSGVCVANVNVNATTDKFATPVVSQNYLTSGSSGPAEILSPLSTTGTQLVAVRLNGSPSTAPLLAKLTGTSTILTPGNSDTFTVWSGTSGESATAQTVSARARFDPVDKTGFAWLENNGSQWYVVESEHLALQIGGTLGATLVAGGNASCSVTWTSNGVSPGLTVTVNSHDTAFYGESGTPFRADLNRNDGNYYFVWVAC